MKILLTIFAFLSIIVIKKVSELKNYHGYLLAILPFGILGMFSLSFLFSDLNSFLHFLNASTFFLATALLICMYKFIKFKKDHTKELVAKLNQANPLLNRIKPILFAGYFIGQLLMIWGGEQYFIIK